MGSVLGFLFQDAFATADAVFAQVVEMFLSICLSNPLTSGGYMHFPWITALVYYMQAIALAVVVILRVAIGIKDGIFKNGGDINSGQSAGEWLFGSLKSIAIICAMPALIQSFVGFSLKVASDVLSTSTSTNLFEGFTEGLVNITTASLGTGGLGIVFAVILGFVVFYYVISVMLQCLKRQIQLVLLSVIGPLVAITTGTSNSSDIITLFKETVSIGVITGLQLLFLVSTVVIAPQIETMLGAGIVYPLVIVGMFSAVKKIPSWIEPYLPNQSVGAATGGRQAGLFAGMMARSAITKVAR